MNPPDLLSPLPQTFSVIQSGIERQLHTGCQLFIQHDGRVIADCGVGESFPGQPMTSETINLWLSAGKPLTAAAICQQWERGQLQLDDRVVRFIPQFAAGGKERITIRHLLTHTCGFRSAETRWPDAAWDETIQRICQAPLEEGWIVGKTAGYHTSTSWFILGEILARITGASYAETMRRELFEPLEMSNSWSAMSPQFAHGLGDRLGQLYTREQGELHLLEWNSPERCSKPSPGANARGPIRELGLFYIMLQNLGEAPGGRILSPQTVAAITARHRVGEFDATLAHIVDFGLGFIVDSNRYGADTVPYGYGKYCSSRTFGHGGAQSSQGWCDPENRLVVAYFFNGRPGEGQHSRRTRMINEAIYQDLNLA